MTTNKLIELCASLEPELRGLCVSAIHGDMQVSDQRIREYNNLWNGASSADKAELLEFMINRWVDQIGTVGMTVMTDDEVGPFNIDAWDAERFASFDEVERFMASQFKSSMERNGANLRMNIAASHLVITLAHKLGRYSGEYVDDFISLVTTQYAYIMQQLNAKQ